VLAGADAEDVFPSKATVYPFAAPTMLLTLTTITLAAVEPSETSGSGPSRPEVVPHAASSAVVVSSKSAFILSLWLLARRQKVPKRVQDTK
jgi:hypothetical protein